MTSSDVKAWIDFHIGRAILSGKQQETVHLQRKKHVRKIGIAEKLSHGTHTLWHLGGKL